MNSQPSKEPAASQPFDIVYDGMFPFDDDRPRVTTPEETQAMADRRAVAAAMYMKSDSTIATVEAAKLERQNIWELVRGIGKGALEVGREFLFGKDV